MLDFLLDADFWLFIFGGLGALASLCTLHNRFTKWRQNRKMVVKKVEGSPNIAESRSRGPDVNFARRRQIDRQDVIEFDGRGGWKKIGNETIIEEFDFSSIYPENQKDEDAKG